MSTYVLIPGAGGEAWYWHLVVPLLEAAGHRAVAVDLPASDPEAGLDAYVAAALAAVGTPEGDAVVVGQSLGGFTALQVAAHVAAEGLAIGSCTLYDLDGPIGSSSVCAVANEVMGS